MAARPRTYERTLAGSIVLREPPVWHGLVIRTHGVEPIAPGSSSTRRVVVHEYNPYWSLHDEQFEQWVEAMLQLGGDPVPRLRGIYGHRGRPRMLVCDGIEGVTLGQVGQVMPGPGLPVDITLAVVHALVPVFRRRSRFAVLFCKDNIWLTPEGQVRTWPASVGEYLSGSTSSWTLDEFGLVSSGTNGSAPSLDPWIGGTLLYELLMGGGLLSAYSASTIPEMLWNASEQGLIPLRTRRSDVPEAVARFADRAVEVAVLPTFAEGWSPQTQPVPPEGPLSWDDLDRILDDLRSSFEPVGQAELRAFVESLPQCPPIEPPFRPPSPDELPDVEYERIPWEAFGLTGAP